MNIDKTEDEIIVELEDMVVRYDREKKSDKENYLSDGGLVKLEEWKIDLIRNHGVELDELRG